MLDTLVRAFRGTVRSPVRTILVVLLLAAGLSFALTSLALAFAASDELEKVKETTGVEAGVSISPDQFSGAIQKELNRALEENVPFDSNNVGRNVEPLTTEQADAIAALPYVRRIETFTVAAVEYDLPDRKPARENDLDTPIGSISLPDAIITGAKDSAFLTDFQSGAKRLEDGRLFTPDDAGKNVVVIDRDTATFESLGVGDKIILKSLVLPPEDEAPPPEPEFRTVEAEVIGIYADLEAASQGGFSPARIEAWYAPIDLVRVLQSADAQGNLSSISIVYDSVDHVDQLKNDVEGMLDPSLFTLTTTEERFEDISKPVETMRNTSILVMVAGLGVVGLIMVMLMALVVRGRLREIGILKAVGARNRHVILQFTAETIGIAIAAVVVAVPVGLASSSLVADVIRPSASVEETAAAGNQSGPDLGAGARALTSAPVIDDPVRTEEVKAVLGEVDATVSPPLVAAAAAVAIGLGVLGALVPIVAVLRLRPAEVLRLEA
ncbi:MAG: ABC transporter permease [Chloroflexi bacterium]|nr:ABC transporter permease [Chloroflexota bacterium]